MIKNIKKRSASETEVTEKKAEATGKNKVFKKNKTEKTPQNGQADKQPKKDISKKVGTKKNKDVNATSKTDDKGKKRFRGKDSFSADELKTKIEEITNRGELSRTARRKLAFLKKLLRVKEGLPVESKPQQKAKNAKSLEVAKNKQNKKGQLETKTKNQNKGKNIKQQKKDEDKDEDENENEDEEEDTELSEDENESDLEEEEEDEENESDEEGEDGEEESEDDEDDDDDDDEGEDDENENEKVKTSNVQPKKVKESNTNEGEAKKKRYVVFVGNLPYTITSEDLKKHFLTKVSHVVDIRIPTKEDNSPRGFAYVEFADNADFEKAFTLHHSMINGRRINVQYSGANKKEGVAKNFKLQALQKAGKFAGGKNKPFQKKFNNKGK